MADLSTAEKGWHVMRQLQVLADYERIPWYLPDMKALQHFSLKPDEDPAYLDDPEVIAFVDELLGRDALADAVTFWWPTPDATPYKVARRLFYLNEWHTKGSLVRTVAINMALKGKFEDVLTYLLGAGDATGNPCFSDIRHSIKLIVRS